MRLLHFEKRRRISPVFDLRQKAILIIKKSGSSQFHAFDLQAASASDV
jgi:hypothetical protein